MAVSTDELVSHDTYVHVASSKGVCAGVNSRPDLLSRYAGTPSIDVSISFCSLTFPWVKGGGHTSNPVLSSTSGVQILAFRTVTLDLVNQLIKRQRTSPRITQIPNAQIIATYNGILGKVRRCVYLSSTTP